MRFYTQQHRHYCGIDLHARTMYVRIIDQDGTILVEKNIPARPRPFLALIAPYRDDLVVADECMFTWYWLADLCHEEGISFVLGHALYMKAIHGGKAKNDRIDAGKIAALLRGGMIPRAYVYPREMRATRDLLRRRLHLVRHRGRLLAHIQNTNHQCNHDAFRAKLTYKANREGVAERFDDPSIRKSVEVDLALIMSVNPGFGGQSYIPSSTEKLRRLRTMLDERGPNGAELEVDGGVNVDTAGAVCGAGASVLVAGAAVFGHPDGIAEAIRLIRRAAEEGGAPEEEGAAKVGSWSRRLVD